MESIICRPSFANSTGKGKIWIISFLTVMLLSLSSILFASGARGDIHFSTFSSRRRKSVLHVLDNHNQYLSKFLVAQQQAVLSNINNIRGGNADPSSTSSGVPASKSYPPRQYQQQQQQRPPPPHPPSSSTSPQQVQPNQQEQQSEYLYDPPQTDDVGGDSIPFQPETFQDRIDTWRNFQMEHAEEERSNLSPRDGQGRMKLLTSASKATRVITFFVLMWRNVHLYEVADHKFKRGIFRYFAVIPLTFLFIANMAGVVASLTSSGHSSKKRLKAILNLDKLLELILILYHIGKLIFSTSTLVAREVYISHIIHSVCFIMHCQAVTRFVWDGALAHVTTGQASGLYPDNQGLDDDSTWIQQPPQRPSHYGTNNQYRQTGP